MQDLIEIYERCDSLMKCGQFAKLDSEIATLDITSLDIDLLIGWLTATLPAKSKLPSRGEFFSQVRVEIKKRGQWEKGLLTGLEQ